jgi:hypothetical protein
MKQLFLTLWLSTIFDVFPMRQEKLTENIPQDILDCLIEIGKDTISTLNVCESNYLNFLFQKDKDTFDFYEKKIAFFKGNTGTIKSTKKEFFDKEKYFIHQKGFLPSGSCQLVIFDKNEERQVGYNAVIISLSKKYITKKEIIKRLKKK